MNKFYLYLLVFIAAIVLSCSKEKASDHVNLIETNVHHGRTEDYSESRNLYFGDLHVHTGWSFDAYMAKVRVTPDQAYKFAKGEPIPHISGKEVKMNRPLDFMAVADHAEYMGGLMQMQEEGNALYNWDLAQSIRSKDDDESKKATRKLRFSIATNWPYKQLIDKQNLQYTWKKMVEIADAHYEPGKFTSFPAYEWTSSVAVLKSLISGPPYAQNLHRNVIFKGGKVSGLPFSSFDSQNPEDLWEWMANQRNQGVELLAIPHNANISDGRMYALNTFDGDKLTAKYIETRLRNEPVNEVVQIKGQSMAHPLLAPKDEFADFEVYQYSLGQGNNRKKLKTEGAYVRQAFKNGLAIHQKFGQNPFQFGIIGSTDSHNGGPNVEENNNIGRSGTKDINAEHRLRKDKGGEVTRKTSVAGLAAVWAKENTRESIYEALERKEVYATSGPRIQLRFFASEDWQNVDFDNEKWDSLANHNGVPMGSQISKGEVSPSFLISAVKDVDGANLDRAQVIKGWIDQEGQTHERIYDVAWSEGRSMDSEGNLPLVGNTVNIENATFTNDIGAISLQTFWSDPDFNPKFSSFYYIRVLEIPTPRWTTFDAVSLGVEVPDDVPSSIQERAWSSPIWYEPIN
tara:strand:- start:679 stop:2562 length:1884 start_codon:yes stop_codon:yes gene_type:complete